MSFTNYPRTALQAVSTSQRGTSVSMKAKILPTKTVDTRHLTNNDMKKLTRIFGGVPCPPLWSDVERYETITTQAIKKLSFRVRSGLFSRTSTNLCLTHKGLNATLVNDIWGWVSYEIEQAIGEFLYPLIMSGALTVDQELQARQLEPLQQMWRKDCNANSSTPPGHEPIESGTKWSYQRDKCPACILARIGSDAKVMFALFAGMVGRLKTHQVGTDFEIVDNKFKLKSKRLRVVKCWLQADGNDDSWLQAGKFGLEMKRLRREWKMRHKYHSPAQSEGSLTRPIIMLEEASNSSTSSGKEEYQWYPDIVDAYKHMSRQPGFTKAASTPNIVRPAGPVPWPASTVVDGGNDGSSRKLSAQSVHLRHSYTGPPREVDFDEDDTKCSSSRSGVLARHSSSNQNGTPKIQSTSLLLSSSSSKVKHHTPWPPVSSASRSAASTVYPEDSISSVGKEDRPVRYFKPAASRAKYRASVAAAPRGIQEVDMIKDHPAFGKRGPPPSKLANLASEDDFASPRTTISYDRGHILPPKSATGAYRQILTDITEDKATHQEQITAKYRALLSSSTANWAQEESVQDLPRPRPESIYASYSDVGLSELKHDKYEARDEDIVDDLYGPNGEDADDTDGGELMVTTD